MLSMLGYDESKYRKERLGRIGMDRIRRVQQDRVGVEKFRQTDAGKGNGRVDKKISYCGGNELCDRKGRVR